MSECDKCNEGTRYLRIIVLSFPSPLTSSSSFHFKGCFALPSTTYDHCRVGSDERSCWCIMHHNYCPWMSLSFSLSSFSTTYDHCREELLVHHASQSLPMDVIIIFIIIILIHNTFDDIIIIMEIMIATMIITINE